MKKRNKKILIPFVIIESTQTKGEPVEISLDQRQCYERAERVNREKKEERKDKIINTLMNLISVISEKDSSVSCEGFVDYRLIRFDRIKEARKEFKQALDNLL